MINTMQQNNVVVVYVCLYILLLQDHNTVGQFRNKLLEEIQVDGHNIGLSMDFSSICRYRLIECKFLGVLSFTG